MKLYQDLGELYEYPDFLFRLDDGFLMKIHGLNMSVVEGELRIAPVYVPLFRYQKSAGQIVIDFNLWRTSARRFLFQLRPPYFGTYSMSEVRLEEYEDD